MKKAILFSLLALGAVTAQAQSKIGGLPPVNPGAVLELESTSKGFLPPRMTSAQRDAINSGTIAIGLVIYNTDNNCLEFWGGSQWKDWCDNTVPSTVAVDTLDCATTNTGGSQPVNGQQTNGFSVFVPYSGGNGGAYASQVFPVAATSPVQELSAILLGGTTSNNGNLQFLISGSPSNSGQAVFPITFGGQSCSFTVDVLPGAAVASLTGCGTTLTPSNTITMGTAVPANTTVTMSYTGGNGGSFNTIAASSTNVIGMTATLTGAPINNGPGNLVWKISGTPSNGIASTATFNFIFAGQSCSFSVPVAAGGGTVTTLACSGPVLSGPVTAGTSASGTTVRIGYGGATAGPYGAVGPIPSFPAGLTASAPAGTMPNGNDTLVLNLAGTPPAAGLYTFNLSFGTISCSFNISVGGNGIIAGNNDCVGKTISVTPCSAVPGASINDDPASTLGTEYNWTGVGGYMGTTVRSLVNIGNQCWFRFDAISSPNPAAHNWPITGSPVNTTFGTAAQWGATAVNDLGYHGFFNVNVTTGSAGWREMEGVGGEGRLYQWSAVMNGSTSERAQGICPTGWHVPSDCEWMYLENTLGMPVAEQTAAGYNPELRKTGAVGSKLGLNTLGATNSSGFLWHMWGYRDATNGAFTARISSGYLWSSTQVSATNAIYRQITSTSAGVAHINSIGKKYAFSVRCLKD